MLSPPPPPALVAMRNQKRKLASDIPNLPMRFKQRYVPRTLFHGHFQSQNVNKPQKIMASTKQTHTFVIVRCDFFSLKATNLSVTADELQMTYFKCKYLRKVIIVVTVRHFLVFLTLCSQLKFSENPGKNRLEPEGIITGTYTSNCRISDNNTNISLVLTLESIVM